MICDVWFVICRRCWYILCFLIFQIIFFVTSICSLLIIVPAWRGSLVQLVINWALVRRCISLNIAVTVQAPIAIGSHSNEAQYFFYFKFFPPPAPAGGG